MTQRSASGIAESFKLIEALVADLDRCFCRGGETTQWAMTLAPLSLEARAARCIRHVRETDEATILCVEACDLERARQLVEPWPVIVAQAGGGRVMKFLNAYAMQLAEEYRGKRRRR
jgi:hypothetical protein